MVVADKYSRTENFGLAVRNMLDILYANNSLLALTRDERVQQAFESLVTLFHKVVLRKNIRNTVGMI